LTEVGMLKLATTAAQETAIDAFFFSSRRRHTRSDRDWSSDVCSSDLESRRHGVGERVPARGLGVATPGVTKRARRMLALMDRARSEERRVGKECRSRGGAEQLKKKEEEKAGGGGSRGGQVSPRRGTWR